MSVSLAAQQAQEVTYVPAPRPVTTDYQIGAMYFPGWRQPDHFGWQKIEPFPERKPLLGYYDEGNPEVADWEIKWCLEHGISYFVYCWYRRRDDVGKPVSPETLHIGHAIHQGLFHAKYRDKFHYAIMWENANAGGVASLDDMMQNLLPFWITNYFKDPGYLKVDNKPVLYIWDCKKFAENLGGFAQMHAALDSMRQACRNAGFNGLIVIGEAHMTAMRNVKEGGCDYGFAYSLGADKQRASNEEAIQVQINELQGWKNANILPFIPTATMGRDAMPWARPNDPRTPWLDPKIMARWKLTPEEFTRVLVNVKSLMDQLPSDSLGHRMLLLDNWNEWGEGHYIAPHAEYGFGYLQAVRKVFTKQDNKPDYRTPESLGLGPYDSLYRQYKEQHPANK